LSPPDRNLPQPISGQAAQVLGCLHLQHLLEKLLGLLDVSQLHVGEGEAVHGLRVSGIDLEGSAQIVEGLQAVSLLAKDGAQILEGHRVPGIDGQSPHGVLFCPREVACFLVGDAQGHVGVRMAGCELEAAV
jgi:hypothetical protein